VVCQLTVQPNGTIFHRSLGDNIVFTCSLDLPAGSVIVNIQWLDQNRVEILDKSSGRDKYAATSFSHCRNQTVGTVIYCLYVFIRLSHLITGVVGSCILLYYKFAKLDFITGDNLIDTVIAKTKGLYYLVGRSVDIRLL